MGVNNLNIKVTDEDALRRKHNLFGEFDFGWCLASVLLKADIQSVLCFMVSSMSLWTEFMIFVLDLKSVH